MTRKGGNFGKQVDDFCATSEKVILRILIFACFALEVGRFVSWLLHQS